MLLKCACFKNIEKCLGIDNSIKAIELGEKNAILNNLENKVNFKIGGIDALKKIQDNSFDGVILSNILDNIENNESIEIIKNINRIIKPNGKTLVKLNDYLEEDELEKLKIKKLMIIYIYIFFLTMKLHF